MGRCYNSTSMIIEVNSESEMKTLASKIGAKLIGGETLELVGDIGAGKTTFTKGLALGLGVDDDVQSPSFTISRLYDARDGLQLAHYDFYRLDDPGIMANEVSEFTSDGKVVTVIEWADAVSGFLPDNRIKVSIVAKSENTRQVEVSGLGWSVEI